MAGGGRIYVKNCLRDLIMRLTQANRYIILCAVFRAGRFLPDQLPDSFQKIALLGVIFLFFAL
jgi:hypothetical protein